MRALCALLAGFGALLTAAVATADYPTPLMFELVGMADQVVIGTITAVNEASFELQVEQTLIGPKPTRPLIVKRFKDWTCSHRWKVYEVGQKELAFLVLLPPDAKIAGVDFQLMSAGAEGEWEILGDKVLVPTWQSTEYTEEKLPGRHEAVVPLAEVTNAIPRYADCFRVKDRNIQQICGDEALALFRALSPVHEELTKTTLWILEFQEAMKKAAPPPQ